MISRSGMLAPLAAVCSGRPETEHRRARWNGFFRGPSNELFSARTSPTGNSTDGSSAQAYSIRARAEKADIARTALPFSAPLAIPLAEDRCLAQEPTEPRIGVRI